MKTVITISINVNARQRCIGKATPSTPNHNTTAVAAVGACPEWVMSGTHKGDFPGMPATGKRFSSVRGAMIVELQDGRIRRCSDYWDAVTFMRQVGLLAAQ